MGKRTYQIKVSYRNGERCRKG